MENRFKTPPGIRINGNKFTAYVYFHDETGRRQVYCGSYGTLKRAVKAQKDYRKENGLTPPKKGRPKKVIK